MTEDVQADYDPTMTDSKKPKFPVAKDDLNDGHVSEMLKGRAKDPTAVQASEEHSLLRSRAERGARELGLDATDAATVEVVARQVVATLYEDARDRLPSIVSRNPRSRDLEEWSWIQGYCNAERDDPYNRSSVFPAFSLARKVPTDITAQEREGALIPVVSQRFPPAFTKRLPTVSYEDPVRSPAHIGTYTRHVLIRIDQMILGKSRPLPDGRRIIGLTNHPERIVKPPLDWSREGREESLERLKEEHKTNRGTIFYGTSGRNDGGDWSKSSSLVFHEMVRNETMRKAYRSHHLEEGEAVMIGRSATNPRSWLSGPGWPYPSDVPVLFEALSPTVLERGFGNPARVEVMAVAGPWIPEPEGRIIHFGGN